MTVTVKGAPASAEQISTIEGALTEAHSLGAGHDTLAACVMCMTQESSCLPINFGDRDSLGPYQQRTPWGPASVREDPAGSTRLFLEGGQTGEPGWSAYYSIPNGPPAGVTLDEAVQRVQVSAFPWAYGQWQAEAERTVAWWVGTLTPPKTLHYERYPKKWRRAVQRYDALRQLEHEGRLTRIEGLWLDHRQSQCRKFAIYTYRTAVRDGSAKNPNWDPKVHRGWLEQQLLRRAKKLRCFPTE